MRGRITCNGKEDNISGIMKSFRTYELENKLLLEKFFSLIPNQKKKRIKKKMLRGNIVRNVKDETK